jgi:hypothetical protein
MKRKGFRIVPGVRTFAHLAILVLLLVSTERPAKAYVDPGSGALVWQGMLASLLGAAFYFRRALGWVKSKVSKPRQTPLAVPAEPIVR